MGLESLRSPHREHADHRLSQRAQGRRPADGAGRAERDRHSAGDALHPGRRCRLRHAGRQRSLCGESQRGSGDLGCDLQSGGPLVLYPGHGAGPGEPGSRHHHQHGANVVDLLHRQSSYNAGGLVAYDSDTGNYWLFQGVPQNPANPGLPSPSWMQLDATIYGTLLDELRTAANPPAAAGPAVALYAYLQAAAGFQVGSPSVAAADQLLQGVQVFEFSDEWYKWMDPTVTNATTIQTAAGVHDFRDTAIAPGARRTRNSTPPGKRSGSASARSCPSAGTPPTGRSPATAGSPAASPTR